eukprot:1488609-Amphidinium_carterae.1
MFHLSNSPALSLSPTMDRACGFIVFTTLSRCTFHLLMQSVPTLPELNVHVLKVEVHRRPRHWFG